MSLAVSTCVCICEGDLESQLVCVHRKGRPSTCDNTGYSSCTRIPLRMILLFWVSQYIRYGYGIPPANEFARKDLRSILRGFDRNSRAYRVESYLCHQPFCSILSSQDGLLPRLPRTRCRSLWWTTNETAAASLCLMYTIDGNQLRKIIYWKSTNMRINWENEFNEHQWISNNQCQSLCK